MRSSLPKALLLCGIFRRAGFLCVALALGFVRPASLGASFEPIDLGGAWAEENFYVVSMVEFHGRLYAGTQRKEDLKKDPPVPGGLQVLCIYQEEGAWRWHEACPTGFESGDALGSKNFSVTGMHVFQEQLYVGTWNVHSGAELWRTQAGVDHPSGLQDWERVDQSSFGGYAVTSMTTFHDQLYAGIFTQATPLLTPSCGIWRSADGRVWSKVNLDGFLDPFNSDATTLAVHEGSLYAGTENGFFYDTFRVGTGTEIWRTDGEALPGILLGWRQVNPDGFGTSVSNVFNINTMMMVSHNGYLYVGTENPYTGAELWRFHGAGWEQVMFGGDSLRNNLSVTYHSGLVFEGDLYICTTNPFTGGEVWRCHEDSWSRMNESGFGNMHGGAAAPVVYEDHLVVVGNWGPGGAGLFSLSQPAASDVDADGVPDETDNCPRHSNSEQIDDDQNGVGDDCQDDDGDGVARTKDCDDQAPSVYPGASDPFDDGIDRDCDGSDPGFWEWDDDGVDSNGNFQDNCGTVPVEGNVRGLFAFFSPWALFFLALVRLKRNLG